MITRYKCRKSGVRVRLMMMTENADTKEKVMYFHELPPFQMSAVIKAVAPVETTKLQHLTEKEFNEHYEPIPLHERKDEASAKPQLPFHNQAVHPNAPE